MQARDPELETLAARLEASGDYRVLRRLRRKPRVERDALPANAREALALDLETTGLDQAADVPIEVGLVRFAYDDEGRILGVTDELEALEDPGRPLDPEVARLTGIQDADLAGQRFPDEAVARLLDGVVLVIAHNAAFDRPFAERRWPGFAELHWGCSLRDIDWRGVERYEGGGLGALLTAHGLFFGAHRAVEDGYALVELLGRPVPAPGSVPASGAAASATEAPETISAFNALRQSARRATVRLWAVGSPFDSKDRLKARGYRWNPDAKSWWTDVAEDALDDERAWLQAEVYPRGRMPALPTVRIDARLRYSARLPEAPPA